MKTLMQARTEIERNGSLIPVDVLGVISYNVDRHYGEDADGNRGEARTIVNEVLAIRAFDDHVLELKLNDKEEELIADKLVHKFLGD